MISLCVGAAAAAVLSFCCDALKLTEQQLAARLIDTSLLYSTQQHSIESEEEERPSNILFRSVFFSAPFSPLFRSFCF